MENNFQTQQLNQPIKNEKNKGGRPMKTDARTTVIRMACSKAEEKMIEEKVKLLNTTKSEFMRELALNGKIVSRKKVLPKEVLLFNGTLNHIAANLNQLTRQHNSFIQFNAMEIGELSFLQTEIKRILQAIETYLRS